MSDYVKALEARNEELESLLSTQNPREIMYVVEPKPGVVYVNSSHMTIMDTRGNIRVFYNSLHEVLTAYGPDKYADKLESGCIENYLDATRQQINVYEYNIKTGAKIKVFG